jgi:FAD/FMN-containing dehydrogenase
MGILSALDTSIAGPVSRPGDSTWDSDRAAWALAVPQEPLAVVSLADASDAVTLVAQAAAEGVPLTMQPRGHGAQPGVTDGAVLVRTSALQDITIDPARQVARVGAGVRWGDLNARLDGSGLIGLAGTNPSVSVVGYLLGGGLSWFGRRHGVAATAIRAVELVNADGEAVRVTAESDPELFWALRGGGGDFGLVTAVEMGLFPHDGFVGGQVVFPIEAAPAVLAAYIGLTAAAPPELTAFAGMLHFPALPFIPEPVRGRSVVGVAVTHLGPEDHLTSMLAPVRAAGPVIQDTVQPRGISTLGQVADEPTDPSPGLDQGMLLTRFDTDSASRLLAEAGDRTTTPLVSVAVRHLGGALTTGTPDGGVASRVDEPFLLGAVGNAMDPATIPAIRGAFASLQTGLGDAAVDRAPYNFLGGRGIAAAYPPDVLSRLQSLKRERDPKNVFRSNRPTLT